MSAIRCYDEYGLAHLIDADSLNFTPAVYAVFIENGRILLLNHKQSNLYTPPGLLVPPQDLPDQAIRHYLRRLVGFTPALGALLLVEEQYRVLKGDGWQLAALYYEVKRPFTESIHLNEELEPLATLQWVDLEALVLSQFQFGYQAVMAGAARQRTRR